MGKKYYTSVIHPKKDVSEYRTWHRGSQVHQSEEGSINNLKQVLKIFSDEGRSPLSYGSRYHEIFHRWWREIGAKRTLSKNDIALLIDRLPFSNELKDCIRRLNERLAPLLDRKDKYITYHRNKGENNSRLRQHANSNKPTRLTGNLLDYIDRVVYDPVTSLVYKMNWYNDNVYGEVVPKPQYSAVSMFDPAVPIVTVDNVENYIIDDPVFKNELIRALKNCGFEVLQDNGLSISIIGPKSLHEKYFSSSNWFPPNETEGFWDILQVLGTTWPNIVDPEYINSDPPDTMLMKDSYFSLRAPDDIRKKLNGDLAWVNVITGQGVHIVMIDSGFYGRFGYPEPHPWFSKRNYDITPISRPFPIIPINNLHEEIPQVNIPVHDRLFAWTDALGHGTSISANIFCVAPRAKVTMLKWCLIDPVLYLNCAAELKPDILSFSWARNKTDSLYNYDKLVAATIAHLIYQNIIVVLPTGNTTWRLSGEEVQPHGFPAQHPDVIAAGGAYFQENGDLKASDYAGGFESSLPGYFMKGVAPQPVKRSIPDVCGLVGDKRSSGRYLALPTHPGSANDYGMCHNGDIYPDGDQTVKDDGWVVCSGTSSATAQIAGVCALLKQMHSKFPPALISNIPLHNYEFRPDDYKAILEASARDVKAGSGVSADGFPTGDGFDIATGFGLVDAAQAISLLIYAKIYTIKNGVVPSEWVRKEVIPLLHGSE